MYRILFHEERKALDLKDKQIEVVYRKTPQDTLKFSGKLRFGLDFN